MFEQFVTSQASPNTQAAYRRNLVQFEQFLGADKLTELEPKDLLAFVAFLRDEEYAPASINQKLSSVKSFLKYASVAGAISPAVYAAALSVSRVKESDHLPKVLTDQEVERLLFVLDPATLSGARMTAFVQLALATGARLAEMVGINIEQVDWQRRRVMVRGKGDKDRVIRFGRAAAEALVAYLSMRGAPAEGPLFTNDQGRRISPRYLQAELRRSFEKAGIENASVHTLRHTHATNFLDFSGDIDAVAQQLGHADIRTTKRYTRLATKRFDRLYEEFDQAQEEEQPVALPLRQRVVA